MGRVVHFEIMADEPERAIRFYTQVFGWRAEKWAGPVDYWLVMTGKKGSGLKGKEGDGIDGAIVPRLGQAPPENSGINAFVCTIEVDDIEKTMKAVKTGGGLVVVDPRDIPGIGRFCYCKDSEGNTFGLMQPLPSAGKA